MDDMDKQSEELGGKSKFFTGEYAKFAWSKIFDSRVSGHELVGLYGEAIQRMNHNPNIPQLFRDIFKNAYLPYRDPETLKSFLKAVGEFEYDHSEKLGDAFEYLLSVMGSQGDAGQFRTPRHIIDFIVKVVDPEKNETILDPACGTAGFLISSYKHILEKNKKDGRVHLTPAQKKRLIENFSGYDISPDMVRLSLVNMYLHGFKNPKIYEYDTLTSEEKWQEVFDVILANPPFMSPKGGIRPHKRFSVQAKRSEVLFVDYIAEHLNPNGRAGIIVPEGIIFQSGTAYKKLRKMLVDHSLYAVVSLPAGVFNPYSGVKTSILMLDKNLTKKTNKILFIKINNDGFGLGAQRREVEGSDLPVALEAIKRYRQSIIENKEFEFNANEAKLASLVEKKIIAKSGDYNLGGDRYREVVIYAGKWDFVELGEVCEIYQPKTISQKEMIDDGEYLVFGANGIIGKFNQYNHEDAEVLVTCRGATCGTINMSEPKSWITGNAMVIKPKNEKLSKQYLFFVLKNYSLISTISGTAQPQITRQGLFPFKIPLPPREVQEQIVAELDNYQKIVDGAKQVVENWKLKIDINPKWEKWERIKLGEVFQIESGGTPSSTEKKYWDGDIKWATLVDIPPTIETISDTKRKITTEGLKNSSAKLFPKRTVMVSSRATIGRIAIAGTEMSTNQGFKNVIVDSKNEPIYVAYALSEKVDEMVALASGGTFKEISKTHFSNLEIPLPPLEIQKHIVEKIEAERALIESVKKLIGIYGQKTKDRIAKVWGEKAV